jgi:hypothetical protein
VPPLLALGIGMIELTDLVAQAHPLQKTVDEVVHATPVDLIASRRHTSVSGAAARRSSYRGELLSHSDRK